MRETTRDGIRSPVVGPGQRMLMFWGVDRNLPPVVTVPEVGRRIGFSQTSVEGISHSSVTSGRYGEASYSAHGKKAEVGKFHRVATNSSSLPHQPAFLRLVPTLNP